jgi:hypothetical protein
MVFCNQALGPYEKEGTASIDGKRVRGMLSANVGTQAMEAAMTRKMIWVEQSRFRGFGCSECGWRFQSSGTPTGKSFTEMMHNFELQRDKEFATHVCADHPRAEGQ